MITSDRWVFTVLYFIVSGMFSDIKQFECQLGYSERKATTSYYSPQTYIYIPSERYNDLNLFWDVKNQAVFTRSLMVQTIRVTVMMLNLEENSHVATLPRTQGRVGRDELVSTACACTAASAIFP